VSVILRSVSVDEWRLSDAMPPARKERLWSDLTPGQLLDRLKSEIDPGQITLEWEPRTQGGWGGFNRVSAIVPIGEATFDQFFNGRMGYRAQYYQSVEEGVYFNRAVVRLLEAALEAAALLPKGAGAASAKLSLDGPHSKVWFHNDWGNYRDEPEIFPARWVAAWTDAQVKSGLFAPMFDETALDLKGTFINPDTASQWLADHKVERHKKIHETGWN